MSLSPSPVLPVSRPTFAAETRATIALAIPLISGQLGQMLMGVVDTVMISQLGVADLGAATLGTIIVVVPLVLGIGLLSSISVRVSQAQGAGKPEEAASATRHGTWLALGLGLAAFALILALLPALGLLGQPAEVVLRTPAFLLPVAASLIPAFLSMAWKNHADALNHPWPAFWILLGGVGLNVVLNWLLIWGHWGFPAMGLAGAGYATLVSRILTAATMFWWIRRSPTIKPWSPALWWQPVSRSPFRSLLAVGFPASLHLLTEVGAFAACTLLIGTLGAVPLAAHQVAINCVALAFMVPLGVAMAVTVRVGEAAGAGQRHRLRPILIGGWGLAAAVMMLSMGIFFTCGPWIVSQFGNDPGVREIARRLLIVAAVFQLVDGLQVVSALALRGINDVRIPAWTAFFAYWVIAVPIGAWLGIQLGWGAEGMWSGLAIGLALAAFFLGIRAWRLLGPQQLAPISDLKRANCAESSVAL